MKTSWMIAAALVGGMHENAARGQMIPIARHSIVTASEIVPFVPIPTVMSQETREFDEFSHSVSFNPLGGSASQISLVGVDVVSFAGSAAGGFGGGGYHGSGSSQLVFDFRVVTDCTFTIEGGLFGGGGVYVPYGTVTLSRTDIPTTLFNGGSTRGGFQTSGLLAAGSYRFQCDAYGPDGNPTSTLNANFSVVPAPWSMFIAGMGLLGCSRRCRS